MISFPDIPGIIIHPIAADHRASLHCTILPAVAPPPTESAAIDHAWTALRRDNPRLHDGPILLAEHDVSRAAGSPAALSGQPALLQPNHPSAERAPPVEPLILTARRATYKTLAAAPQLNSPIRALGVQALLTAHDAGGNEHLLLGRRGSEVRIYQGLWENAPSGTLSPPPHSFTTIDLTYFIHALICEGTEELGLKLNAAAISWLAMLDDSEAHSLDVVLAIRMHEPIDPRATPCASDDSHRWEYAATAWVPVHEIASWITTNPIAVSPSTQALIRWIYEPQTQ